MRIDDVRKPEGWSALPRLARAAVKAGPRDLAAKRTEKPPHAAGSFRNGGRHQIGTMAGVKSESLTGLRRNSRRACSSAFSVPSAASD